MYINNSELHRLELLIGMLDSALERNPKDFTEGYINIKETIKEAEEASKTIREREVKKQAKKIVRNRFLNEI